MLSVGWVVNKQAGWVIYNVYVELVPVIRIISLNKVYSTVLVKFKQHIVETQLGGGLY